MHFYGVGGWQCIAMMWEAGSHLYGVLCEAGSALLWCGRLAVHLYECLWGLPPMLCTAPSESCTLDDPGEGGSDVVWERSSEVPHLHGERGGDGVLFCQSSRSRLRQGVMWLEQVLEPGGRRGRGEKALESGEEGQWRCEETARGVFLHSHVQHASLAIHPLAGRKHVHQSHCHLIQRHVRRSR